MEERCRRMEGMWKGCGGGRERVWRSIGSVEGFREEWGHKETLACSIHQVGWQ